MDVVLLFVMVIGLMLVGVPIAVSLGFSSIIFLLVLSDTSLSSVAQTFFQAMAGHYTLLAIPFFILASSFMSTGGVAQRIIRFSIACVGICPVVWRLRVSLPACCLPRCPGRLRRRLWPSGPS